MPFILDTVTVSEFRKISKADRAVVAWQATLKNHPAYLSVITIHEIRFGIRMVERRDPGFAGTLGIWLDDLLSQSSHFPLIPVDLAIAKQAADYRGNDGLSYADSLIAASAKVHGLTLATRNTADFFATGIALFNPWEFGK